MAMAIKHSGRIAELGIALVKIQILTKVLSKTIGRRKQSPTC